MPKKTRKEKIIADLRRKLRAGDSPTIAYQMPKPEDLTAPREDKPDAPSLQAIRNDLKKTLLLAFAAIASEVALFFLFERR